MNNINSIKLEIMKGVMSNKDFTIKIYGKNYPNKTIKKELPNGHYSYFKLIHI